jgi:PucR family transcriptional regulator, purine catabolism regulatory protein
VVTFGRVRYWLAAVTRRRDGAGELALLRVVERLLELVTLARTVADDDEQALRSGLLGNALEERDPRQLQEIARRAERFGITYAEPCRVVVATLRDPARWAGAPAAPSPAERLRRQLASGHTPYLLDEQPERLIALIQGEAGEVEAWVRALEREGIDLVAGIGRSHDALPEAQASLLDAELAVQQVDAGRGAAVVRFEDCDLARWTIGLAAERLEPKVEGLLAEIKADPRLYETLVAYLDADLDVRATASALHLHVNSVRYRLGRIESIVGRSLQRLATLADLYIAVTVDRTTASARARPAR